MHPGRVPKLHPDFHSAISLKTKDKKQHRRCVIKKDNKTNNLKSTTSSNSCSQVGIQGINVINSLVLNTLDKELTFSSSKNLPVITWIH